MTIDEQLDELIGVGIGSPEAAATVKRRILAWMCPCIDGQSCGWPQCAQIANGIGRFAIAGRVVLLKSVPDDLLRNLPEEDVAAICAAVGKPVRLVKEDAIVTPIPGTEEIEFYAEDGSVHTIWIRREHLEDIEMDDEFKHEAGEAKSNSEPKVHPGWNIVDPSEVLAQHCVGCGRPVVGDRYAWRQRGPFWFEFAHVECAQDIA